MAFISRHFSRYSSANNHLIGEAAGLFVASTTWPFWSKATEQWRDTGLAILVDEALKQSHPDGAGREQAIAYQQFVLDFLMLCLLAGRAGRNFISGFISHENGKNDGVHCIHDGC